MFDLFTSALPDIDSPEYIGRFSSVCNRAFKYFAYTFNYKDAEAVLLEYDSISRKCWQETNKPMTNAGGIMLLHRAIITVHNGKR